MTAFVRAFIFCNGCDEPFDTSTVPAAPGVSEARRQAKARGWVHKRDGRDFCDGCAARARRAKKRRRARRNADLWGQGLTVRQRHSIRDVPLVGAYL
ncbi:hypothetical protein L0F81_23785 [Streptomyces tricolor]|uniref:HNH endonuclease n=1 Tax=Streptomyces tricolor TaxID=68277 RepID=A0ABS9JL35_9ACTN|nr:hypothetical protein [Streptomyces tricolor]MCG0066274.1 hypothetical protein [Streptomyces tricolor]